MFDKKRQNKLPLIIHQPNIIQKKTGIVIAEGLNLEN